MLDFDVVEVSVGGDFELALESEEVFAFVALVEKYGAVGRRGV